jgi:hypothetical protein
VEEATMALVVTTANPDGLWTAFSNAILKGELETWRFHTDATHFTHTSAQWANRVKAVEQQGILAFNIVKAKGTKLTVDVYAEYHGLLLRALLAHFDTAFSNAVATALAASGDIVGEMVP